MTGRHAAIVKRLYESWNRASAEGMDIEQMIAGDIELLDPEIEFVNPPEAVDPGVRRGIEGFITALRNLREALGIYRIEIERLEEDRDHVAASVLQHGKAPGSGIEMTFPLRGVLWTFREDRVIRFEWFVDPEQAFARLERPD